MHIQEIQFPFDETVPDKESTDCMDTSIASNALEQNHPDSIIADKECNAQQILKRPKKGSKRKRAIQAIIMCLVFFFLEFEPLFAEWSSTIGLGFSYTDNAFQLSDYDLSRVANADPIFDYIHSSDDAILQVKTRFAKKFQYRWWQIEPVVNLNTQQYLLNNDKYKFDITTGIRFKRKLGSFYLGYGYSPFNYLRKYTDDDGTLQQEKFDYQKDIYRAELNLNVLIKSTLKLSYRNEQYKYNQYFTEYDGVAQTWTTGWLQNFPFFYLDGSYAYRVMDTGHKATEQNPDDSSYESNKYSLELTLKKTVFDSAYPQLLWRPQFAISFEERFYSGLDTWHKGRIDNIYDAELSLQFFFRKNWNLNLDYSYEFRNVEAVSIIVGKYKEYSENKVSLSAEYSF